MEVWRLMSAKIRKIITFPTVITKGKYSNQLEKIRVVLSSGSHETGSTAKKVTESDSAKPGPYTHIYFLSQGSRVHVEMGTKSEKVCVCVWCMWRFFVGVYFTLYLQGPKSLLAQIRYIAFLGFQIEENFWEAKF